MSSRCRPFDSDRKRTELSWSCRRTSQQNVLVRLSEYPGLGRERPDLGEDLRSFPVMNVMIVYRGLDGGVEIVRVFHESRDLPAQF